MNRFRCRCFTAAILIVSLLLILGPTAAAQDEPVESFEWRGADLRDAFRHVGRVFGVNIVLDQSVTGQVTMTVNRVTCEQAIQYLARSNSYNYRKHGDTYIIGKEAALKANFDVTTTRVFRIYYAEASKIADEVSVVVQGGRVRTDATTNSIIVTGTPLELDNVQEIIKQVDIEAPQVSIEARLEEMTEDAKRDLGLQVGVSGSISWDFSKISLPDISVALQALQEEHKSRSIARPNITTLNGQEGKILVGDKVPVKISTTDSNGVNNVSVQFIEVGVKLLITPRVNRDGDVTLYLKPEVSTITSTTSEGMPSISTREVETILRVKDGQTIIIGGLLRQTDLETVYKLPLIGDLPVLGKLFQFKGKSTAPQTELVFFITPRILRPLETGVTAPAASQPAAPKEGTTAAAPPEPGQSQPETPPVPVEPAQAEPVAPVTPDLPPEPEPPVVVVIPADEPLEAPPTAVQPPIEAVQPPIETVQPSERPSLPTVQVSLTETVYTVKKGDTLYSIARKYGVKIDSLFAANELTKDSKLAVGSLIKVPIPKDHIYVLKPGDTLWRLSKRYGTTVELLCEINGITDSTKLSVNQALILPCALTDIKDDRY